MDMKRDRIPLFPDKSRVCFVGDSLTSCSYWAELIHEHYLKVYPKSEIRMFNGGIGSSSMASITGYLEEDVFVWKPTHVVIAFGANDMGTFSGSPQDKLEKYKAELRRFSKLFTDRGIVVYYLSEPNYSYNNPEATNSNPYLWERGVQEICEEQDTYYCDIFSLITPYMQKYHDRIISDGTHYTYEGECLVSKLFLYSQGFDIDIADDEYMLRREEMTYYGDHKNIFDRKLRAIWLGEQVLFSNMYTADVEEKYAKAKRIIGEWKTSTEDKWWKEFRYYRAMDYLEYRPHMDFYMERVLEGADCMVEDAKNNADK